MKATSTPRPMLGSLPPTVATLPEQAEVASTRRMPKRRGKFALIAAALMSVAGIAGAAFLFMPRTGALNIYVSGPEGRDVGAVDIFVDNQKVCSSSPCAVPELEPGIHDVHAEAKGYAPAATKGVEVKEGGA